MQYEFIKKGNFVMREGDASDDKFYIILSGKASVSFQKDKNVYAQQNIEELKRLDNEQQEAKSTPKHKVLFTKKISQFASNALDEAEKRLNAPSPEKTLNKTKFFKPTAVGSILNRSLLGSMDSPKHETLETVETSPLKKASSPTSNSAFSFNTDARKSFQKLSVLTQKSEIFAKVLNESGATEATENSVEDFSLTEHGTLSKILEQGSSFGEKALTNPGAKRSASIYTVTDCEFIVIMKKDFLAVYNRFSRANNQKLGFLLATVPHLDKVNSQHILEDYMYSIHIADAVKGSKLTEQGKQGERVYFIANGQCILEREVEIPNPSPEKNLLSKQKTKVQVARIEPNTVFGEELLFGLKKDRKYRYTATVPSITIKHNCIDLCI